MFDYRANGSQENSSATIRQIEENPGVLVKQLSPLVISPRKKEIKNLISGAKARTANLSKILVNQTEIVCREFGILHSKAAELETKLHALPEEQQEEKIESTFVNAIQILEEQIVQPCFL